MSTQSALDLYRILSESDTNLRQPVALEKQLLNEVDVDSEVGQSMLQLLQVGHFPLECTAARQHSRA